MEHGFSWILAWQSAVPVAVGILALMLPGWLSGRWAKRAAAKSEHVANQLGTPEEASRWSENKAIAPR
jgi:hypothetical protein